MDQRYSSRHLIRVVNIALSGLAAGLLAGCSVYVPMLPAAPQLRDKGQVEVQANSYFNRRWEAGATYSPDCSDWCGPLAASAPVRTVGPTAPATKAAGSTS
ncbi:hypothetical protein [Hymenobacter rubripertinctus]|uniref:hypothetical protein n=1 Tax=Hymenobacter rubripertinctus TaxID=2029981 RepID=UPI0011C37DA6|nr:hypothetical protein [Hymenobacter rubripertinctus]